MEDSLSSIMSSYAFERHRQRVPQNKYIMHGLMMDGKLGSLDSNLNVNVSPEYGNE